MSRRRGKGEGSIFQQRDGRWVARVELPPAPNGKRRRRTRQAKTRKEAQQLLRQLVDQVEQLDNVDGINRTVAEAVESYITSKPYKTPATREADRWRADLIIQGIGTHRIGDLKVRHCDGFLRRAASGDYGRRPLNTDSTRRVRGLLRNALRNEMRLGNISTNVADLANLPVTSQQLADGPGDGDFAEIRRTLDHDEYRRIWRTAQLPLAVVIDLCGRNGLRPSEARALRWECINFEAMTLRVDRQMNKANKLTGPKTKKARRTIPLDDLTIQALTDWQRTQTRIRQRAARWYEEHDFVISTRYGTPKASANLYRMVTAVCEDAGIDPIVPYELRHTAISFQLDAGRSTTEVADWAGTSVRMIEDVYRHKLQEVVKLSAVTIPDLE